MEETMLINAITFAAIMFGIRQLLSGLERVVLFVEEGCYRMSEIRKLEGKMDWIKTAPDFPEEYQGKKSWSIILHPTRDSLDLIRDMQADGIKNVVKRGEAPGDYFVKFSRKCEKVNKAGKVLKKFDPPKTYMPDGSLFDHSKMLGNGCEGYIEVNFYEHPVMGGGKSHAAMLEAVHLSKVNYYGEKE